jgi:serine-type D-Ala-D-Ala carboxypeptidase (penicillin-binding protein 5/6)
MRRWALAWAAVCVCVTAAAQAPSPPELTSTAHGLWDLSSGQRLSARGLDTPVEPGGWAKLMTAYLVLDALKSGQLRWDQALTVSERAASAPGPLMFVPAGARVPVSELVQGLLVQSGNDAALVLAEAVSGTSERFVAQMNRQAQALGMGATRYFNPTGESQPAQVTTLRDTAQLAMRVWRDFPARQALWGQARYRWAEAPQVNDVNPNPLLTRDPSVDGLMAAQGEGLGWALISTAKRPLLSVGAAPGERRLLALVWGAASDDDRARDSQKLLNWGFGAFEAVRLLQPGQAAVSLPVWMGQSPTVDLGHPDGVVVTVPMGAAAGLRTELVRPQRLLAPLLRGQVLGTLRVRSAQGVVIQEYPLSVLEPVPQAGVWGRGWDALRLWVQ